ncbi:MAG: hypothetical protein AABW67_01690 [Nanoarchaeota archaeon]
MTKLTDKLTNIIAGTLIPITLALSSGCTIQVGGIKPADLSNSHYSSDIEKSADDSVEKYKSSFNISDLGNAVNSYGSVGNLYRMDETIKQIMSQDADMGLFYAKIGEEYYSLFKKNAGKNKMHEKKNK